eukprot:110273_1
MALNKIDELLKYLNNDDNLIAETQEEINNNEFNIQELKHVDIRTKNAVFGFVREHQQKYFDKTVLVELIYYVILYYYQEKDEWDINMLSCRIKTEPNDKNTIIHVGGPNREGANGEPAFGRDDADNRALTSSYLTMIIENDKIFKWRFKIKSIKKGIDSPMDDAIVIGIVNCENYEECMDDPTYLKLSFFPIFSGYGFSLGEAVITDEGCTYEDPEVSKQFRYGVKCKTNDIVEMELNMKTLQLKYMINGIDYGTAFNVQKGRYKAAVAIWNKGDSVKLL